MLNVISLSVVALTLCLC